MTLKRERGREMVREREREREKVASLILHFCALPVKLWLEDQM